MSLKNCSPLSPLTMTLVVGMSYTASIMLRSDASVDNLFRILYNEEWNFIKCFSTPGVTMTFNPSLCSCESHSLICRCQAILASLRCKDFVQGA